MITLFRAIYYILGAPFFFIGFTYGFVRLALGTGVAAVKDQLSLLFAEEEDASDDHE